jgi:hypothetical protein
MLSKLGTTSGVDMIRIVRVAAGSSLMAAALALTCAGVAGAAPAVVGMTYNQAQQAVQDAGMSAVVSTTIGTALPQGDCIVTSQTLRSAVSFGRDYTPSKVLLSLNCNDSVAAPGKPGNSAASPEGRVAKQQEQEVEWRGTQQGQVWCAAALEQHPEWFPLDGC